jgi:hypothetical protein
VEWWAAGHSEKLGALIALPLRLTVALTWRALVVLHTQIEYSSFPPAHSCEPLLTTWAVMQIAPAFGGLGECDGEGVGDFEGEGEVEGLFEGLELFDGLGLALLVGLDEWLPEGFGLPEELLLVEPLGVGLAPLEEVGLPEGVGLPVALALILAEVVALTEGLLSVK